MLESQGKIIREALTRMPLCREKGGPSLITLDGLNGTRYHWPMIKGFRCKGTEKVFQRRHSRRCSGIERMALRKLLMLDAAGLLEDLRVPPANRLERLSGDRRGQLSIRINDQWRICFRWREGHAHDVEIVDYH